ncbi:MAG TPA: HAD family hydrolase [Vicinamibacterales bacterium]|jgi:putative hydrolase of the HAD superfamily|nr:HAD family hydrolase [Vicinamibacterales bacterium]
MATRLDAVAAVFFDVDFTLIYPGPMFQDEGYAQFAARFGIAVDRSRFSAAVRAASSILDEAQEHVYDGEIFVRYTRRIVEGMGGTGERLDDCAREIYREWAANQHFFLYDDVAPVLNELARRAVKIGLISNSHRCLSSFQQHFELEGLIAAAVSSSEHGYMKPHPSIFEAAITLAGVTAAESVMVGDSLSHDIDGARRVGMRGVLLHRSDDRPPVTDVPVIRRMGELLELV